MSFEGTKITFQFHKKANSLNWFCNSECKAKAIKESSSRNREEEFVNRRDADERFYKKPVERIALDP